MTLWRSCMCVAATALATVQQLLWPAQMVLLRVVSVCVLKTRGDCSHVLRDKPSALSETIHSISHRLRG